MKSVKIKTCPNSIASLDSLLKNVLEEYHIDDVYFPTILISLTEALNNAIHHGNLLDKSKSIFLKYGIAGNLLTFRIKDEGSGFNEKNLENPTIDENLECCGGRGVWIMRELAHELRYLNNGTEVEISFKVNFKHVPSAAIH